MKTSNITVRGHKGTWYIIGTVEDGNNEMTFHLLEHETHGEDAAHIVIDVQGHLVMEDITGGMEELELIIENEYRICSECSKLMAQGYCVDGGRAYYCEEACLHKHISAAEWEAMYEEGGDSYWTEWN